MDIKHLYSFTAMFEDGTTIFQDHKKEDGDKSDKFENKSKFTDVLEKEKESKLISFVIHNDEQSVGVDLRDGHFEINGIPFFQHRPDLDNYKDFRIIYYRTIVRVANALTKEDIDGYIRGYTVGWQVTYLGKNIKKIITI